MKAKKQVDRRAIIISAVLTALLLTGAGSVVLASHGLAGNDPAAQTAPQSAVNGAPFVVTVEPLFSGTAGQAVADASGVVGVDQAANDQVAAAYQAQLNQAYQALQEAYAQIDALQSAQTQAAPQARFESEHENEHMTPGFGRDKDHDDD